MPPTVLAILLAAALAQPAATDPGSKPPSETPQPAQTHPAPRRILLVDDTVIPDITVKWETLSGPRSLAASVAFSAPEPGTRLEETNLRAAATLGGLRLDQGAGHPDGAILRLALVKHEPARALFAAIKPATDITLELRGVRFNQPVKVEPSTALLHLKYALADIEACSLPESAASLAVLSDPQDTLGGRLITGLNARPGDLAGHATATVEPDGTVTLRLTIPYALLRHPRDPWDSELPGTFFEPLRLFAEVEVLPVWAEPIRREAKPSLRQRQAED